MSLPGPTIDVALWRRAAALTVEIGDAPRTTPPSARPALAAGDSGDSAALRAQVGAALHALARRIEEDLPDALKAAPQAWDRVDNLLVFFDPPLTSLVTDVRRRLELTISTKDGPASRAVALEGLMVLEAACGLARLYEQRLSSLIRLRVRSGDEELLPGGRPFLDLAAAMKEAARAWA